MRSPTFKYYFFFGACSSYLFRKCLLDSFFFFSVLFFSILKVLKKFFGEKLEAVNTALTSYHETITFCEEKV